jgi:phosphatidylserine decarboxylase
MERNFSMELGKSGKRLRIKLPTQDQLLACLYGHQLGRVLLRPLVSPAFSKFGGIVLSSRLSAVLVKPFAKHNRIDLSGCKKEKFDSFNDFFTRELKPTMRPVDMDPQALPAPCDARLSVFPIGKDSRFLVKNTSYTVSALLLDTYLARKYEGGYLFLFRLCVDDYHRYIYPVDARKSCNIRIPGVFHTVNPVANDVYPIYKENTREYCLLKTEEFGTILMMEVGAMLVGKIENHQEGSASVKRGEEKGNFAFGGSTILLLTPKNSVEPLCKFLEATEAGRETKVRMGEVVGVSE